MSDTVTTLGAVGILPVGDWGNSSAYDRLNAVKYQGSMYVALEDVPAGVVPTNTTYWMLMAEKGESVQSVEKTSTSGLVDTYTMTMSSGRTFTFTVTNGEKGDTGATGATGATGNGIQSIYKTGTSGLVDTYTILYTNGQTTEFEVTNGTMSPSDANPLMDGTADPGTSNLASRGDHVHPSDTSKANTDGYYQQMTVGNAEQLVSTVFIEDKTPYTFRTSGGSADIGDREYDKIVGGTLAWNQMQANTASKTLAGVTYTYSNGKLTVSNTATASSWWLSANDTKWNFIAGHVYYFHIGAEDYAYVNGEPYWYIPGGFNALNPNSSFILNTNNTIKRCEFDTVQYMQFMVPNGKSVSATFMPQCFDLTQMFGSTIADYIYTLETTTPGAGVAWFRKLFPKDYYAYNAGTLLSVNASAHKLVGFNAYDHANTSAKVVGGNQYQITGTYTSISLDGTAITPDSDGYFTPSVSGTLSVVGGNATDTCIHLVWDGERDGEYEPYEVHNYPLDSSLTLRGIPKLDSGNNLYYDGDTYEADGTVTRKYGVVDLGTLNWTYQSTVQRMFAILDGAKYTGTGYGLDAICSAYPVMVGIRYADLPDKSMMVGSNFSSGTTCSIVVNDSSYSDATVFKSAMSGVYLVYELATPTTESADPFASPQIVNDFGTEEYVVTEQNGVAVPVGHITKYANNLRAKLEMAPDSPSQGDGDYIVRQTDGENEYVALSSNATVSGLTTRCPVCPTDTDGTYVLKATVSGGAVVYSWEAE